MSNKDILQINEPQLPAAIQITPIHLKGALRLGSVILPGNNGFPEFHEVQPAKYMGRMIDYMYEDDREAILIILKLLAYLPKFLIKGLLYLIETGSKWNGKFGAPFRMISIALKGLVFTIYYSDMTEEKVIFEKIGWDAKIVG